MTVDGNEPFHLDFVDGRSLEFAHGESEKISYGSLETANIRYMSLLNRCRRIYFNHLCGKASFNLEQATCRC